MSEGELLLREGHRALGEGRLDAAEAALGAARSKLPDHPDVLHLCGFLALQRGNESLAAELIAAAIVRAEAAGQRRGEFHLNLGNALKALRRNGEALEAFRRAVEASPSLAEAHNNLAAALEAASRWLDAAGAYRRALALAPAVDGIWINLAHVLMQIGDAAGAEAPMRRVHALDPSRPTALAELISLVHCLDTVTAQDELALCRRFDRLYAQPLARELPPPPSDRSADRRLRIGYIGAGTFCQHTTAFTILPLVEAHDRLNYDIVCYSDLPLDAEDLVSRRFRTAAASFRSIHGLSDAALAALIREDRIDIAVDVVGYPSGSRLLALARRPAPVQVNLLLMGSFGLDAVGWAVGDCILTPPGSEDGFSERIERIELAYAYAPILQTIPPLRAVASGRPITFGSLNQIAKSSRHCLETWARILGQVPGSRLLLKARSFADAAVRQQYLDFFARNGVAGERLDLRGWTPTQAAHIEVLDEIDIALDPFPYGGVITTCEALWLGVPIVSLRGNRVLGRYGAAFLHSVGFPEWSVATIDDYIATATKLAADPSRLAALRQELRSRAGTCRLFDGQAFARSVEAGYRRIWRDWCGRADRS